MYTQDIQKLNAFFSSQKTLSYTFRIAQLKRLKTLVQENVSVIQQALYKDLGKSPEEAYVTEIGITIAEIDHSIKHLKRWMKPQRKKTPLLFFPGKSYVVSQPYGLSLIIASWNYPFKLLIAPAIASIAAGNVLALKPSEISAHTSALINDLFSKYFKDNYIKVVTGGPSEVSALLKEKFGHIFFTGSTQVGKIIYQKAADQLTPCTLELGGKSPAIVDKHTNISVTAKRLVWGKFINAGQTCVAPDYVLVHQTVKSALIDALKKEITSFYTQQPQNSDLARIISEKHFDRLLALIKGNVVLGGQHDKKSKYIAPCIIDQPNENDPVMQEEIFGPILPILTFSDTDQAITFINKRPKPLALYVFSSDKKFVNKIITQTSSGGVCVNETIMHMTSTELPFGGVGNSGFGSYNGKYGFDNLSHQKAVMKRSFLFDIPQKYPPVTPSKFSFLKFALKWLS